VASRNYANHSALQEKEKELKTNATCGAKCYEQYKKLNRNMSLQKMSLVSQILMADWYSSRCALTWKLKGTKFNRLLFQLVPKMHRTEEIEFGLLPTPSVMQMDYEPKDGWIWMGNYWKDEKGKKRQTDLTTTVKMGMLPTPTCQDAKQKENSPSQQHKINELSIAVAGGTTSHLNPRFVAEMMGFPPNWTELPFQSGDKNQSKDMETP